MKTQYVMILRRKKMTDCILYNTVVGGCDLGIPLWDCPCDYYEADND